MNTIKDILMKLSDAIDDADLDKIEEISEKVDGFIMDKQEKDAIVAVLESSFNLIEEFIDLKENEK